MEQDLVYNFIFDSDIFCKLRLEGLSHISTLKNNPKKVDKYGFSPKYRMLSSRIDRFMIELLKHMRIQYFRPEEEIIKQNDQITEGKSYTSDANVFFSIDGLYTRLTL